MSPEMGTVRRLPLKRNSILRLRSINRPPVDSACSCQAPVGAFGLDGRDDIGGRLGGLGGIGAEDFERGGVAGGERTTCRSPSRGASARNARLSRWDEGRDRPRNHRPREPGPNRFRCGLAAGAQARSRRRATPQQGQVKGQHAQGPSARRASRQQPVERTALHAGIEARPWAIPSRTAPRSGEREGGLVALLQGGSGARSQKIIGVPPGGIVASGTLSGTVPAGRRACRSGLRSAFRLPAGAPPEKANKATKQDEYDQQPDKGCRCPDFPLVPGVVGIEWPIRSAPWLRVERIVVVGHELPPAGYGTVCQP